MALQTKKMKKIFFFFFLVRIKDTTHDDRMPPSRMGHILSEYKTIVHYTDKEKVPTGLWNIYMTNGEVLKFHEMFLEFIDGSK